MGPFLLGSISARVVTEGTSPWWEQLSFGQERVQQLWCTCTCTCPGSAGWPGGVEAGHEFSVGAASGIELVGALLELYPNVGDLGLECGDSPMKLVDVVGGT